MKAFFGRHIVLTGVIVVIGALFLINSVATGATEYRDPSTTIREIEKTLRNAYEWDLRDRVQTRGLARGSVAVVSVSCARTQGRRLLCLAQIAATGRAKRLVRPTVTFRVRQQTRNDFIYTPVRG